MNDQELRALVRDAVARHLRTGSSEAGNTGAAVTSSSFVPQSAPRSQLAHMPQPSQMAAHPSHVMYRIVNVTDSCVIEPTVACNHCGYCKSHGH
jgi:hypothetical protein